MAHIVYGHGGLPFPHPSLHSPISGQNPMAPHPNQSASSACLLGNYLKDEQVFQFTFPKGFEGCVLPEEGGFVEAL